MQVKRLIPRLSQDQIQWFWSLVDGSQSGDFDRCWEWQGKLNNGYGDVPLPGGGHPSNRVAYFIWNEAQPGRYIVRHCCHNRACCNPTHLLLGTQLDNINDMKAVGRDNFWGYRNQSK